MPDMVILRLWRSATPSHDERPLWEAEASVRAPKLNGWSYKEGWLIYSARKLAKYAQVVHWAQLRGARQRQVRTADNGIEIEYFVPI